MKNKKVIYIVGSIVLLILIGVVACKTLILNTPLKIEKAAYLYIDSDDNIDSVYTKLKKDSTPLVSPDYVCSFHAVIMLKTFMREPINLNRLITLGIYFTN